MRLITSSGWGNPLHPCLTALRRIISGFQMDQDRRARGKLCNKNALDIPLPLIWADMNAGIIRSDLNEHWSRFDDYLTARNAPLLRCHQGLSYSGLKIWRKFAEFPRENCLTEDIFTRNSACASNPARRAFTFAHSSSFVKIHVIGQRLFPWFSSLYPGNYHPMNYLHFYYALDTVISAPLSAALPLSSSRNIETCIREYTKFQKSLGRAIRRVWLHYEKRNWM